LRGSAMILAFQWSMLPTHYSKSPLNIC